MSPTYHSLGIERLSVAERMLLVEEIWDSIAADVANEKVPAAHQEELQRRLAEDDQSPEAARPWEEVKAELI